MNWFRKFYIWNFVGPILPVNPFFLFFFRFYILKPFINFVRCYWDLIHSHADCIVNGICDGRHDRGSGPWPASFAPYGPSGSFVSTRMVSISGMSNEVGLFVI